MFFLAFSMFFLAFSRIFLVEMADQSRPNLVGQPAGIGSERALLFYFFTFLSCGKSSIRLGFTWKVHRAHCCQFIFSFFNMYYFILAILTLFIFFFVLIH